MVDDINNMLHIQFPVTIQTKDETDACNNMVLNIIYDKSRHHMGINEDAMVMFYSLTSNVSSICKIRDTISNAITPTNSRYSQGYTMSSTVWNVYINPCVHLQTQDNCR